MKRSLALLALCAAVWAVGSTWYYDCKIKRVCGPDALAAPLPTERTEAGLGADEQTAEPAAALVAETLETPPIQMTTAPATSLGPQSVLTVAFDARSAAIAPPADVAARLDVLRQGIAAGKKILVRGHSDGHGARERIAVVSRQRAEGMRDWLLTQGFAASDIADVESREDRDPIANNGQADGRAKNRRAEALLVSSP